MAKVKKRPLAEDGEYDYNEDDDTVTISSERYDEIKEELDELYFYRESAKKAEDEIRERDAEDLKRYRAQEAANKKRN